MRGANDADEDADGSKQEDGERPVLYLSHISSLSLMTRAENPLSFMEEE